jgi:hypothetical protein
MLLARHPVKTNIASAGIDRARKLGNLTPRAEARARVYNDKLLKMPAEQAARIVLDGVEAGRPRVLVGNDAKGMDLLVRLFPRRYPKLVVRFERRAHGTA